MTIIERLVEWTWRLDMDQVLAEAWHAAGRQLLEGTGTTIAGYRHQAATYAEAVAQRTAGPPESTVIGSGRKLPAAQACFTNGTLVHALDFDDTHATCSTLAGSRISLTC